MMRPMSQRPPEDLAVGALAWAGLLGRWLDFAKASVALPDDGDGGRWKRSVVPFIEMQATIWALRELETLDVADRPFARDRAERMVRSASAALGRAWGDVPMPPELVELQNDATIALREALYAGLVELVWPGPGPFVVPAIDVGPLRGTLALMPPGSLAMPGEPVAWFSERDPVAIEGCDARVAKRARQVYRELDERGRIMRDVIAPLEGALQPGLPMLVALSIDGAAVGRFLHPAEEWLAMQRRALDGRSVIPVVVHEE